MSIPKTLSGLALLGLAAGCNAVPFLSVLTPYLASAGIGAITVGIGAKVWRVKNGGAALNGTEKKIIKTLNLKKK